MKVTGEIILPVLVGDQSWLLHDLGDVVLTPVFHNLAARSAQRRDPELHLPNKAAKGRASNTTRRAAILSPFT